MYKRTWSMTAGRLLHTVVFISVVVCLSVDTNSAQADDGELHWSAQMRWGLEYDDNPHRLESYEDSGAALMRYLLGADIVTDTGTSGQVTAALRHGGTRFYDAGDANALVTQARSSGTWWPRSRLSLQVRGDVKDRTESGDDRRDYTRGGGAAQAGWSVGPLRLWSEGGWRFLAFKPTPAVSHNGPRVGAGLRWRIRDDLALNTSWGRTWRSYATTAWEVVDDRFVPVGDGVLRDDQYDLWSTALGYQDFADARLRYQYARNRSNSHGQQMSRHSVEATLTAPVVWDIFASVRGEIQQTRYEDPVFIDDSFHLDEDNRNTLVAAVSRQVTGPWDVELRASIFSQEFGVRGDYSRKTIAIAVRGHFDDTQ